MKNKNYIDAVRDLVQTPTNRLLDEIKDNLFLDSKYCNILKIPRSLDILSVRDFSAYGVIVELGNTRGRWTMKSLVINKKRKNTKSS